jgi:hypothetical protein
VGMGQWNVYRVIGGNGSVECIQDDWWEWVSGMYTGIGGNGSVESIQGDSRREMIVPAL